ncbi:alpha/beta hydrolase [Chitinophaga sp. Cy-1792]|uniref:alpha/beta hydrolase n=1 Tax=Chitinophaga sp. Cy-1792 TaxID=2608339 RepID=UPI00142497AE|nr:alpha/beta fold hydrolase [Chitinophaga sp. Cy-1792]NIG52233.1 lysophospholipase [Chitinophaga sp. Cy-1792]
MKKILKRAAYSLLIIILIFNVIAAFHAWKFTHFYDDPKHINKRPEQMSAREKLGMVFLGVRISKSVIKTYPDTIYQQISLPAKNGLKIDGWWIPVANPIGNVILFHGYNGSKQGPLPEATYFRSLGYNTLLIDFRAHGNSEGNTCSIGYYEQEEVKLAMNYVKQQSKLPVTLWGVSMGAAAILHAMNSYGADLKPVKVILECPYATLKDAVDSRMRSVHLPTTPLSQLLTFWGGLEQGFWGFNMQPAAYAKSIHVPVLYFWGKQDIRVMEAETKAVYGHLATADKKLVVLEDAGHESFCRKDPAIWKQQVQAFMRQ